MQSKSSEQFDVLSNTLRLIPEEILRLNYFINEINDPEEGISNVELACVNVFNQIYGFMCSLKDEGHIDSIYKYDPITTILCIRHALQHQSGRIKNNLRDAIRKQVGSKPVLVRYSATDKGMMEFPFYINVAWLQQSISGSNNAKRLPAINAFWNLDKIKTKVEKSSGDWNFTYICAMALITEAVRQIRVNYGNFFKPTGFDSEVYYNHFIEINPIDASDYAIIT